MYSSLILAVYTIILVIITVAFACGVVWVVKQINSLFAEVVTEHRNFERRWDDMIKYYEDTAKLIRRENPGDPNEETPGDRFVKGWQPRWKH